MKKLLSMLLAILMVISLFSCAEPDNTPTEYTVSFEGITRDSVKVKDGDSFTVPKDLRAGITVPDGSAFIVTYEGRQLYPGNKITVTGNITITCKVLAGTPELNIVDGTVHARSDLYTGDVIIPEIKDGVAVTTIGYGAFDECVELTSVIIPDSVVTIGDRAFHECKKLTSIAIPANVTFIGQRAFAITQISSIELPAGLDKINMYMFESCPLESITIPDNVTSIDEAAFQNCKELASITIPEKVTEIGHNAFLGCDKLTSITIPGKVTTIGHYIFYGCDKLTTINVCRSKDDCTGWDADWKNGCDAEVVYGCTATKNT